MGGLGKGIDDLPDEPTGFRRPDDWARLDQVPPEVDAHQPTRRPDFAAPSASAPAPEHATEPAPDEPAEEPVPRHAADDAQTSAAADAPPSVVRPRRGTKEVRRLKARRRPPGKDPLRASAEVQRQRSERRRRLLKALPSLLLAALTVVGLVLALSPRSGRPSSLPTGWGDVSEPPFPPAPLPSGASGSPLPEAEKLPATWLTPASTLRPDLHEPRLLSPDNGFDTDRSVVVAGQTWVVLTGLTTTSAREAARIDAKVWLHGLSASTGQELWHTPLRSGVCATTLLDGRLACAEATRIDRQTGLGTQWRIVLVDPATGQRGTQRTIDAWVTQLAVQDDRLVVIEQRQPAPHAVLRGFDASLSKTWTIDLAEEPNQRLMFSENRAVIRSDLMVPEGLALDRVRLRRAGQFLALGSGATAFVDLRQGTLAGLFRCSRMVDDGKRIWCNQRNTAQAYDHRLQPLYRTDPDTRLVFHDRDVSKGDVQVPVFADAQGRLVKVDLATGKGRGVLLETSPLEIFGTRLEASVWQSGSLVLVETNGVVGLDSAAQRPLWAQQGLRSIDILFQRPTGDVVVIGSIWVNLLDVDTGTVRWRRQLEHGIYRQSLDAQGRSWASWGLDEVSRYEVP